jgi:hypothetical protein
LFIYLILIDVIHILSGLLQILQDELDQHSNTLMLTLRLEFTRSFVLADQKHFREYERYVYVEIHSH